MIVKFEIQDLHKLIYWTTCKFLEDQFHHSGNASKRDLLGGFYDRWFNRAPEFLIFRSLLKDKSYDVIIDNFLYGQDTSKNAPDIIGLKDSKNNTIVKFAEYKDGDWIKNKKMPIIEVKTFRESQNLISVGDTQMEDNNYYVIVESHIPDNYLTAIFENCVFDKKIHTSLSGNEDFIISDKDSQIIPLPILKKAKELGHFELIGIFKGNVLKENSLIFGLDSTGNSEKPRYFFNIEKVDLKNKMKEQIPLKEGLYKEGKNYVPFYIKKLSPKSKITLVRKYKSCFYIEVLGPVDINRNKLDNNGYYKINFKIFDRKAKKREYIGDKRIFKGYCPDNTSDLIRIFDKITKQ